MERFHQCKERSFDLIITGTVCRSARYSHIVQPAAELIFMQSVYFLHKTFDPVADNTVAYLLADRYANSAGILPIRTGIEYQISVRTGSALPVTSPEIVILPDRFHSFTTPH